MVERKISEIRLPLVFSENGAEWMPRLIAAETAIAISFSGSSYAVMMATPDDIEDFAYGFCLSEGIIENADEITGVDVVAFDNGIDLQIALLGDRSALLAARARSMAGPVGCGLCGLESIDAAIRPLPMCFPREGAPLRPMDINAAVNALSSSQPLFANTRAVHAAGFYLPDEGLFAVREDVGRHNALDKLIGAMARHSVVSGNGVIVVTSRLSVEMVQKCAIAGVPVLIAISAPTMLAIDTAEKAGITLIATARGDGFSVFTHAERISCG